MYVKGELLIFLVIPHSKRRERNEIRSLQIFAEQKRIEWSIFNNNDQNELKNNLELGTALRINSDNKRRVTAISDINPDHLVTVWNPVLSKSESNTFKQWAPVWERISCSTLGLSVKNWNTFMNKLAFQYAPEVISTKAYWKSVQQHIWVFSPSFGWKEDFRPCVMLDFYVTVKKNGKVKQSNMTKSWMDPKDINKDLLSDMVIQVTQSAIDKVDSKHFPSGIYSLILGPLAAPGIFHEVVGHGLESDIAGISGSTFNNSLGDIIGNDKITIIDDPTFMGLPGSYKIDDEGTTAYPTTLVEEGKIVNYLTHLHSGYKSNGHGRVLNYAYPPLVRMSNTFLLPGQDDPEEMIKETKSGIYVKNALNGDVNMITGEFQIQVTEGFLIENGKLTFPIPPTQIKGDGRKLLRSIDMVGNDFAIHSEVRGGCGKLGQSPLPVSAGSPTVRIKNWEVQGVK